MSNFLIKLKLIYLPFLLVAVSFIAVYSAFTWLFIYRFPLLDWDETLTNFGLPFCLPAIPAYIWLWPRIKTMPLKTKKDNGQFGYFFIVCMVISVPAIISQEYLQVASGKLTAIDNITNLNAQPLTKYYTIKDHYIDKFHPAVSRRSEVSGKNSEHLTFYLYVACPILKQAPKTANDTIFKAPNAWLGILYTKSLSNNSSDEEKETAYKELGEEADKDFRKNNFDEFVYLDHIRNNDNRKGYYAAIQSKYNLNAADIIVFEAKSEPFKERLGDKLGWIFKSFGIGAAIFLIMLSFPKIDKKQIESLQERSAPKQWAAFVKYISSIRIDRYTPLFVPLIALNILVFVIMVCAGLGFVSFDGKDLYVWGANFRPAVVSGQWWRLLTNIFLHGGVMHLLFNMYGLFFVALFLEPVLGKWKFITAYFLCGIMASVASIVWHPETLSVGASGAIFGLYGILLILLLFNKGQQGSKKFLLINTGIFIVINLIMGIRGGIDNAAHIGGLLAGILCGCVLNFFVETPKPQRKYQRRVKAAEETQFDENRDQLS